MMRMVSVPNTDLTVSSLSLGCGGYGTRTPAAEAHQMLDLFVEAGGNFLDTAHIYAAWVQGGEGISERTIGDWMKLRGNRGSVVVGTKGGHPLLSSMSVSRLSSEEIRQDLAESLERLQTDYVDLYYLHRDDPARPVGEIIETMAAIQKSGMVKAYGVSNWREPRIREALEYARAHDLPAPVANQVGWSLAERNPDENMDPTMVFMNGKFLAMHRETGLFAAAYSSQAAGFFAGSYGRGAIPPAEGISPGVVHTFYNETNFARLERARELAVTRSVSPNDIALGYILSQPFPTCAVIGCGTEAHLRDSLSAGSITLTPEELTWLTDKQLFAAKR